MPKLFNVMVVYDVFVVAETEEDAKETIHAAIHAEPPDRLKFSEEVAIETTHERSIRTQWLEQRPYVGSTVNDTDFGKLSGKSTLETFKLFHVREEQPKEQPKAKAK